MSLTKTPSLGRAPSQLVGGWEAGLLILIVLLYLGGAFVNPAFFGSTEALHARAPRQRAGRHHRRRHDLRHRQQGSRPVGRLHLRPGGGGVRPTVRAELSRSRRRPVGACLPASRRHDRTPQRRARHHPEGAGVHRHADDALHRPRLRARAHPWPVDLLSRQGERASAVLPVSARPTPSASTTRSSIFAIVAVLGAYVLAKTRWGYETFATGGNAQAASLCRHPDELGAHPRLSHLVALRGAGRPDVGGPGQGRHPALRRQRRADRHRRGDHRRRLDPRRPRPGRRLLPRRHAGGAARQGAARGLADHPHHQDRRRGDPRSTRSSRCRSARCRCSSACC